MTLSGTSVGRQCRHVDAPAEAARSLRPSRARARVVVVAKDDDTIEYMSMSHIGFIAPSTPAAINEATEAERQWWASASARYSRVRREKLGLSVERAAELSGLELSQWHSLETGWVPEDVCVILAIATALQVRWSDFELVALFARAAQQKGAQAEC